LATLLESKPLFSCDAQWQAGDRVSVSRCENPRELLVPEGVSRGETPFAQLTAADGTPLSFRFDAEHSRLVVPALPEVWKSDLAGGFLEYAGDGRFRLVIDDDKSGGADSFRDVEIVTDGGVRLMLAGAEDGPRLLAPARGHAGVEEFQLASRAARVGMHGGFDQLICLPLVREMELLEHQIRTATTVLGRFRGRALLCDEVGLGKTIEAGLILAELSLRRLAKSVLVLTPPSLVEQWQGELRRKFSLDFISYDDPAFRERGESGWQDFDQIIVSTHTAKREPHRSAILARRWDLVIIDEAHHLRNRTTQLWKFASELEKQFMLLLTATPVQNNLDELFNLVTLLEPGLLRTSKQFQRQFVDRKDKLTPRNVGELHALLAEVMVRNQRNTVGLQFTRRWATTLPVRLSQSEDELYRDVTAFVKQRLSSTKRAKPAVGGEVNGEPTSRPAHTGIARMALVSLQMALGSSSPAAAAVLSNMAENPKLDADTRGQLSHFAERASQQPAGSKLARLEQLLAEFQEKIVIFTQFRATQAMLARRLAEAGHQIAVFHGGLSRLEKEAAIQEFRGPARILLCSEAGSEGRNLQFAHAVCNFDLPWNPMKIEQRIGRLSRIGQAHDVLVYNLVAAGTIEAAVLHLLDAKLSMFELVIGEIDMILGNLEEDHEFQDMVADLWTESSDGDDFLRRIEELGNRLLAAKQAYIEQRAHDDRLFGSRFAPDG
jgi:SNF2 family DNA or RNA helicase